MHNKYVLDAQNYGHAFYPLVCLFSQQHETIESVKMAMDALNGTCLAFFGVQLKHGAVNLDHSDGLLGGMKLPDRPALHFGNCWSHLARACECM